MCHNSMYLTKYKI